MHIRLFAALLVLLASATASEAAPNIVVIMTDDQEDTGSVTYMPKLRALIAEQGVTFTNSFVDCPLCAPSRASFFTGQAAHNHGIKANNPLDEGGWAGFKPKEADALPVWLKQAGYKTALLGKYLNRYGQQSTWGAWLGWAGKSRQCPVPRGRHRESAGIGYRPVGTSGMRSRDRARVISTIKSTRTGRS